MFAWVNRLLQIGVLLALAVLVALLWHPARGTALGLAGLGGITLLLLVLAQRKRAASIELHPTGDGEAIDGDRAARFVVTRLLGELTRTQVDYLNQGFDSAAVGASWLRRALPRSYRPALGQLLDDLEAARRGESPNALRLVLRIIALRKNHLGPLDRALDLAKVDHPNHEIARPTAFVVTENIDADQDDSQPELCSVAGWDPAVATLLPRVDSLTIFGQRDGKKRVRGQIPFELAISRLGDRLEPLGEGEASVYATEAIEDDAASDEALGIEPLPLGFIVSS